VSWSRIPTTAKIGREKIHSRIFGCNSITKHTGLLPIETTLLFTVVKALAKFVVQRTMYKITGMISEMSKNGIN
jgi:hypothetical protein